MFIFFYKFSLKIYLNYGIQSLFAQIFDPSNRFVLIHSKFQYTLAHLQLIECKKSAHLKNYGYLTPLTLGCYIIVKAIRKNEARKCAEAMLSFLKIRALCLQTLCLQKKTCIPSTHLSVNVINFEIVFSLTDLYRSQSIFDLPVRPLVMKGCCYDLTGLFRLNRGVIQSFRGMCEEDADFIS